MKQKTCFVLRRCAIKKDASAGNVVSIVRNGEGKEYQVVKYYDGHYTCTCPAFGPCYHISHVRKVEGLRMMKSVEDKTAEAIVTVKVPARAGTPIGEKGVLNGNRPFFIPLSYNEMEQLRTKRKLEKKDEEKKEGEHTSIRARVQIVA